MNCEVHPAERVIFDEQGRGVTLGTSEAELRLQCIYAVGSRGDAVIPAADLVREADVLFRYVMGGADKDQPAQDGAVDGMKVTGDLTFKAAADFPAAPVNAKAAEPSRPPLSEIARSELRRKALALHDDMRRDGHHRENARLTMVAYDEKIAGIRQQIADIECDLGERFA